MVSPQTDTPIINNVNPVLKTIDAYLGNSPSTLKNEIVRVLTAHNAIHVSRLKRLLGHPDEEKFAEAMVMLLDERLIFVNYADFPEDPLIIYLGG